jgi:hypothetical protein
MVLLKMDSGVGVCFQVLHRMSSAFCLSLVGVLSNLTDVYMSPVQGLCLASLVFILAEACSSTSGGVIKLKLFKRVCLMFSSQRARALVSFGTSEAVALGNLFLAVAIAVVLMFISERRKGGGDDLAMLLTGIMYLYGNMFMFVFKYGVFAVTISALALSVWLGTWQQPPKDQVHAFIWQLAQYTSTNLLNAGVGMLVVSTRELEVLECMAISALLPALLPSMQLYLTYLAAQRLVFLAPGYAPLFFCIVILLPMCPLVSPVVRAWLSELCFTYVAMTVAMAVDLVPVTGIFFVVVLLHYADFLFEEMVKKGI